MTEIATYQEYLDMSDRLSFEEAERIYGHLIDNANTEDEDFEELWHDFLVVAIRYANIRANWRMISRQERMDTDDARTACHDSVISHLNAVTRCMEMNGWDTAWRNELGRDERLHRKRIGDFACYLAYVYGLNAR
ncbi:MAG: hypothetical protein Q4A32_08825 [Lachnospiraceae bacterium]|nr:hypothetical protein [Lachnospiraceae bacterium]